MLAKVNSSAIVGLDAVPVEVEVDIASQGLPSFIKVGTKYQNLNSTLVFKSLLRGMKDVKIYSKDFIFLRI